MKNKSPARMRKKRFTDRYAQNTVIVIPKMIIPTPTIAMFSIGNKDIIPGSRCANKYNAPPRKRLAAIPEKNPIQRLLIKNGRLMNPHVAPTSFIVCNRKRLAYIVSLTRLLISDHDIIVSNAKKTSNANPMRFMLLFMASISSL